jgi:hypothetical protein
MHSVLVDVIDFGSDILLGIVGWYLSHNPEKVVRWCSFGREPKSRHYRTFFAIIGWIMVASACFCAMLIPVQNLFDIRQSR